MKLPVFVFFILKHFFNRNLFAASPDMTQINCPKSAFSCNSINFVFIFWRLYIWIACLANFSLMTKVSMVDKYCWLVSLSFYVLIEDKRTIGMDFESFKLDTLLRLLGLEFRINFQIFMFLGLFFNLYSVRSSVAWFWGF